MQVRAGEEVDNAELVKFAQLFNDELTLDNLERVHLTNLCRFIGITPFGTDEFLRVRLRARLSAIKVRNLSASLVSVSRCGGHSLCIVAFGIDFSLQAFW